MCVYHLSAVSMPKALHIIIIVIIIIIIIIILVIAFMQGIYNYIPETNHVSMIYSVVAAVLYLQSVLHVPRNVILPLKYVLHFYISTSRGMCAVPNMAVFL